MKHRKKSNTGILFELLTRAYVKSIFENKQVKSKKILGIMIKYFNAKSPLAEELNLISLLVNTPINSFETGSRLLSEVKTAASYLDEQKLKDEKFNLLIETYEIVGKDLFATTIPNYKKYASAYQLINDYKGNIKIKSIKDKVMLEEEVISNLIDGHNDTNIMPTYDKKDQLVQQLSYKIFDKKYSDYFSSDEKKIINEYVTNPNFKEFAKLKFNDILKNINANTITDLKVIAKLNEVKDKVNAILLLEDKNELAYNLLLYTDLLEEMKKLESK